MRSCTSRRVGGPFLVVVAIGVASCAGTATTSSEPVATGVSHATDHVALAKAAEAFQPPDHETARAHWCEHLETDPTDRAALIRVVRCSIALGEVPRAVEYLQRAASAAGSDPVQALEVAMFECQLGQRERARERAAEALRDSPPDARTWYLAGCLSMAECQWDEAETRFRAALDRDREHAMSWCNLGATLLRLGRFGEALEARTRGDQLARAIDGWMFPSLRWVEEGIRFCDAGPRLVAVLRGEATAERPEEELFAARLGYFRGEFAGAIRACERAFAREPALQSQMGERWSYELVKLHACEVARLRRANQAWQEASARARGVLAGELERLGAVPLFPHMEPLRMRWLRRVADDPDLFECHAIAATDASTEGREWSRLLARVGMLLRQYAVAARTLGRQA